jgi:NADH:ubiquinone oxidoreductase subunit 3 (subunit A)
MYSLLISPPVSFLILLGILFGLSGVAKRIAAKGEDAPGKMKSYACGEEMAENKSMPNYAQFFKFAFFFTIMHVVILQVASDPVGISPMSAAYLLITVVALYMLLRR